MDRVASQMAAMETGKNAELLRALIAPYAVELHRECDRRACLRIEAGEMTPELALQFWMEKYAYWRLMTKLGHQERRGVAAAAALKPLLDSKQEGEAADGQQET